MAVKHGVQAVSGLSSQAHHLGALGDQGAMVAHLRRRYPDRGQQAGSVQASQDSGSDLVGHNLGASDKGHVGWVDDGDRVDVRQQVVVDLKGVGRHLQDHGILGGEVFANPIVQVCQGHPPRRHDLVLVRVDSDGDQVMFVHVQADETSRTCFFF